MRLSSRLKPSLACILRGSLLVVFGTGLCFGDAELVRQDLDRGTYYALIIGAGEVQGEFLPRLRGPEKDAHEFYRAITDQNSGLVKPENALLLTGEQVTKENILSKVRQLHDKIASETQHETHVTGSVREGFLASKATLIVYYSGHSGHDSINRELLLGLRDSTFVQGRFLGLSVENELLPAAYSPDAYLVFIADGCGVGEQLIAELGVKYPNLAVLAASKEDDLAYEPLDNGGEGFFTQSLVMALTSSNSDLDEDGFISIEEAYNRLYPEVVTATKLFGIPQYPSVSGRYVHRILLSKIPRDSIEITFDGAVPSELRNAHELLVNNRPVTVEAEQLQGTNTLKFLGKFGGSLGKGVNYFEAGKQRYVFWQEERKLKAFAFPYKHSFAVLVAIDDYDRIKDSQHRGKTGFPQLGYMTAQAKKLKQALISSGFSPGDILELYDEKATSLAIDDVLKSFWKGGIREDVDRLFFYFGGHGGSLGKEGFLVTYDFDSRRPTSTSLLMTDLTRRYAENTMAHHLLVALDACDSGLAVYKTLAQPIDVERLKNFNALAVIRNDFEQTARDVLVAGTDDQPAIWDNGGIFTQALIDGISGDADYNRDGIIQFQELAVYIRDRVAERAAAVAVRQTVGDYKLTQMGSGQFMFFKRP
jgi:uncharacterized caspase-like protein